VIAAAGNQGAAAGSAITRHPWVIPVVAYTQSGRMLAQSNVGRATGMRGVGGPGEGVVSLAPEGGRDLASGTSVAAPFVTGAAALLWSLFPAATAAEIKNALLSSRAGRRRTVIPPLLDAWAAYEVLSAGRVRSGRHDKRQTRSRC
jgi:subtilisin family serine protease